MPEGARDTDVMLADWIGLRLPEALGEGGENVGRPASQPFRSKFARENAPSRLLLIMASSAACARGATVRG